METPPTHATTAIGEWLAAADNDPRHALRWWESTGTAILPAGNRWDAIRTADHRGRIALEHPNLTGPVIHDAVNEALYFLVPVGTSEAWNLEDTNALGVGYWVRIPSPTQIAPSDVYWVCLPDEPGDLHDPEQLLIALGGAK